MKSIQYLLRSFTVSLLLIGAFAQAATVTGTVTNKTTGKPAAGDTVLLVSPMTGMSEVARATTDARGRYTLNVPSAAPFLIKAMHQGAEYFIEAPKDGAPGDITVFDVAAKVQGVSIEADVLEVESSNGQLTVNERYFVHNISSPPTTQWSSRSFEVVLPAEAIIDGAEAQRPSGLPTNLKLDADGPKGHYAFNFPIQPDNGEKDTLFQISYHLPYNGGKYTFRSQVSLPADSLGVLLPKSMTFTGGAGAAFKSVAADPGVQTFVAKNATPGNTVEFTISGSGSIPREEQGTPGAQQPAGMGGGTGDTTAGGPGSTPGGGIGNPINTPDPLSKYKWWILGGLALLLAAAAAFLLRKPAGLPVTGALPDSGTVSYPAIASVGPKNTNVLNVLKEELFTLESERISGAVTPEEYAHAKAALDTILKRALNRK